ncbi:Bacterial FdrA protein [Escherichia coli]|uniref:Bacterial FdrA protein n=1 Tax=Escherichia coli TaxID=562 RepID=A0A447XBD4_ECOLX|nr:Bacterial FdrA protein [Escherichia coli]
MIHAFIKKGCFQDSVSLMIISRKLSESENVDDVSVMMGTPANKALLDTTGFWHDDFNNATPNDICVAIRSEAADAGIAQAIMQQLEEALKQLAQGSGSSQALTQVRRWDSACQKLPRRQSGADFSGWRVCGGAGESGAGSQPQRDDVL